MSHQRPARKQALSAAGEPTELLDRAAALALVGGNEQLLAELATLFLQDCPQLLEEINGGLRRGDAKSLHFAAHTLRGAASWFGPSPAARLARDLEDAARAGDLVAAAAVCSALEAALRRLTPALTALAQAAGRATVAVAGGKP